MGLAEYFFRDNVALSQVLNVHDSDILAQKLEETQVAVAFGEQAASTKDGRWLGGYEPAHPTVVRSRKAKRSERAIHPHQP